MVEADEGDERMPLPLLLRLCALGIMAPALSEASQGQELHLSHSLPTSPSTDGSISINGNGLTWGSKGEFSKFSFPGVRRPILGLQTLLDELEDTKVAAKASMNDGIMGLQKAVSFSQRSESVKEGSTMGRSESSSMEEELMHMMQDMQNQSGGIEGSNSCAFTNLDMLNCLDNRETLANERTQDLGKKQHELERKTERILRRLRKLQCRGLTLHSTKQISKLVSSSCKNIVPQNNSTKLELLKKEDVKGMTTTALVNLIKKMEGGDGLSNNSDCKVIVKLNNRNDVEDTAGQLMTQLKQADSWLDSDATECSSGGDSCDEQEKHPRLAVDSHNVSALTIKQRALWKWAAERASIVSRWSWLQQQVTELEYKIRQQQDLHKQVRSAKGPVVLGDTCNLTSTTTPHHRVSSSTTTECETLSPKVGAEAVEGFSPKCGETATSCVNGVVMGPSSSLDDDDATCVASRTRPLKSFRKRQLLRSAGLHQVSKRANRLCTVRCGCFHPVTPCIMCGGRVNNVAPVEADVAPISERISLLDGSFHPVLSFSKDASLGVRVEHLLKGGNWQKMKSLKVSSSPARRGAENGRHETDGRKKPRLSTPVQPTKSHRRNRADDETAADRMKRKRHAAQVALATMKRERSVAVHSSSVDSLDVEDEEETTSSRGTSPCPSLASSTMKSSETRRKKQDQSYDIDNIVIPYSIASSTRVEKLEYKEIQTPGWRYLKEEEEEHNNFKSEKSSHEFEDFEDHSEEPYRMKHEIQEMAEREKNCPNGRRSFNSRNLRSGATSPVSPYTVDFDCSSPLATPPSTPLSVCSDDLSIDRRRPSRCASPEPQEEEVPPWEPRQFPMSKDEFGPLLNDNMHTPPNDRPTSTQDSEVSSNNSETGSPPVIDDDPNDPEWTVKQGSRGKLVLKLTKR